MIKKALLLVVGIVAFMLFSYFVTYWTTSTIYATYYERLVKKTIAETVYRGCLQVEP